MNLAIIGNQSSQCRFLEYQPGSKQNLKLLTTMTIQNNLI